MEKIIKLRGSNSRICGISGGLFEGGGLIDNLRVGAYSRDWLFEGGGGAIRGFTVVE